MITGKLSNGFNIEVDEEKAKSYRFVKLIGKASSPDNAERIYASSKVLEYLIGEEGEEALLEYMEKQTGKEPTEKEVTELTIEIINMMKQEDAEIKKSSSSEEL